MARPVEALDPMVLGSGIREACQCPGGEIPVPIPPAIQGMFDEELVTGGNRRRLLVTLGQFSIIRLERDAQITVPFLAYAIPTKQCCDTPGCGQEEDPCEMFSRIPFPEKQFLPRGCPPQCACQEEKA